MLAVALLPNRDGFRFDGLLQGEGVRSCVVVLGPDGHHVARDDDPTLAEVPITRVRGWWPKGWWPKRP